MVQLRRLEIRADYSNQNCSVLNNFEHINSIISCTESQAERRSNQLIVGPLSIIKSRVSFMLKISWRPALMPPSSTVTYI